MASYSIIGYPGKELPESYKNLIYSKWMRSLRYGNDFFKMVDSEAYYESYHHYISLLLARDNVLVRLAALSDDPDVVLGFSVCRGSVLDYVHVHKDFRKMGIGTLLVPVDIDTITHITKTGLSIWGSKYSRWKFNPFA